MFHKVQHRENVKMKKSDSRVNIVLVVYNQ
jgi:hypothetical protein